MRFLWVHVRVCDEEVDELEVKRLQHDFLAIVGIQQYVSYALDGYI